MIKQENIKIAIIGQGYVGLPLAIEFGKKFPTIGFDIDKNRIIELKKGLDNTNEATKNQIKSSKHLTFTHELNKISLCNIYIITVPTPIDEYKTPDLSPLKKATKMIGKLVKKNRLRFSLTFPKNFCIIKEKRKLNEKNNTARRPNKI